MATAVFPRNSRGPAGPQEEEHACARQRKQKLYIDCSRHYWKREQPYERSLVPLHIAFNIPLNIYKAQAMCLILLEVTVAPEVYGP